MSIDFSLTDKFVYRHVGPKFEETQKMLSSIGENSLIDLIDKVVPEDIRLEGELNLPVAESEYRLLNDLKEKAEKNKVYKSYIGLGYNGTIVPPVIQRNIFENPGWYTQYTPYQAEIAQGRLEALLNFQTMVADLTKMDIANASLLDEGTSAAEAMIMFYNEKNKRNKGEAINKFFVSAQVFPQTLAVINSRATPLNIEVVVGDHTNANIDDTYFGALVQYPCADGEVVNYRAFVEEVHNVGAFITFAADLMSLALLTAPGCLGADAVVGTTQRFGVPMGFGGPHAAYFATRDQFKRVLPGRIIGVSLDTDGNPALRMALQTREQHIKREKATSNICTAQALLAIMAGMYGVYHGPEGIRSIAFKIHAMGKGIEAELKEMGYEQLNDHFFDTLKVDLGEVSMDKFKEIADAAHTNFRYDEANNHVMISLGETTQIEAANACLWIFAGAKEIPYPEREYADILGDIDFAYPQELARVTEYLEHPVFNLYHTETDMMRYIKSLENKDLSLTHSMIPLGSCTMKLNAAVQLMPLSWPEFAHIHPFAPKEQVGGYMEIVNELETYLSEITGFAATSLQPNSGAQGEYTGLMTIRAYHEDRGETNRNIVLIPASAHGTNPASAVMAGMKVVVTKCDEAGNIDLEDLRSKATEHSANLSALMVTYPSTHGVYERTIKEVCQLIHDNGGLVYMDGANMNAQVALTNPAIIGADVCHLNLHKTFAIPHGGGGPGMGPICVNEKLKPFLPGHTLIETGGEKAIGAVSAAPFGSASILIISWSYIRLLGKKGLLSSTRKAILNANYLKSRLEAHYPVLYTGPNGYVAHEFILDFRQFKNSIGVEVEDIAKRLMDYGFHAPTVSFPVAGTLMIEPTESENIHELDRFIDALIAIRSEIAAIEDGTISVEDSPLKFAPHTTDVLISDWDRKYSRKTAVFPLDFVKQHKFWPSVGRINNTHGDRNLICTCPSIEEYEEELA
jgi:glycine dehydrogenase